MISGASLQIWSVSVGHKLVVQVLHWQESSELGPLCFDCRCYLQLRMGKNNLLSFKTGNLAAQTNCHIYSVTV